MPIRPLHENDSTVFRRNMFLVAAILQVGCGLIFATDVLSEFGGFSRDSLIELAGIVALAIGAGITLVQYRNLLRRNVKVERALSAASGAFQDMIDQYFEQWMLTTAERDVALLFIKGVSATDVATMRNTREGTIKAQSAAIYRKAGVSSRSELLSLLIEEMIAGLPQRPVGPA